MDATVNARLLQTKRFDSGALGPLAMIIHQFVAAGRYRAAVLRRGREVANIAFTVDANDGVPQLDIDLAVAKDNSTAHAKTCNCKNELHGAGAVSPTGYVLFYASAGDGYSVQVTDTQGKGAFDSTKLGTDDLFAVTLLEPARYSMSNSVSAGEINVTFNAEAAQRMSTGPLEAQHIDVTTKTFDHEHLELASGQGLVFRLKDPTRIVIEQKSRPSPPTNEKPAIHWKNPTASSALRPRTRR